MVTEKYLYLSLYLYSILCTFTYPLYTLKQELEELVTKMENEKERDIHIDQRFHRTIIGTKGDKIREIRDKFNQVQISFPDPGMCFRAWSACRCVYMPWGVCRSR